MSETGMTLDTMVNVSWNIAMRPHVQTVAIRTVMSGSSVPSSVLKLSQSVMSTTTTTSGISPFRSAIMNLREFSVTTVSP